MKIETLRNLESDFSYFLFLFVDVTDIKIYNSKSWNSNIICRILTINITLGISLYWSIKIARLVPLFNFVFGSTQDKTAWKHSGIVEFLDQYQPEAIAALKDTKYINDTLAVAGDKANINAFLNNFSAAILHNLIYNCPLTSALNKHVLLRICCYILDD